MAVNYEILNSARLGGLQPILKITILFRTVMIREYKLYELEIMGIFMLLMHCVEVSKSMP